MSSKRTKIAAYALSIVLALGLLPTSKAFAAPITGDGYNYDATSKTLTCTTNEGCLNWRNDRNITKEDVTSIVLGDNVTEIPVKTATDGAGKQIFTGAFENMRALTSITFDSNLQKIGRDAFYDSFPDPDQDPSLEIVIDLSNTNISSIGIDAFYDAGITGVKLPQNSTAETLTIGISAFKYTTLTSFTASANVVFEAEDGDDEGQFCMCPQLASIDLSAATKLEHLSHDFASSCPKLHIIKLPNNLKKINIEAFAETGTDTEDPYDCNIPTALVEIADKAFAMSSFTAEKLVLPDTLKKCGLGAFGLCDIGEVVLPAHLEELGGGAFGFNPLANVSSLKKVTFKGGNLPKTQYGTYEYRQGVNFYASALPFEHLTSTQAEYGDYLSRKIDPNLKNSDGDIVVSQVVSDCIIGSDALLPPTPTQTDHETSYWAQSGKTVGLSVPDPLPSGQTATRWTVVKGGVTVNDVEGQSGKGTFAMGNNPVEVNGTIGPVHFELGQIDINMVQGDEPTEKVITISNTGNADGVIHQPMLFKTSSVEGSAFELSGDIIKTPAQDVTVPAGGSVTFSIKAKGGLATGDFDDILVISSADKVLDQIPVNLHVAGTYSITPSVAGDANAGTISPNSTVSNIAEGASQTFVIQAADGYKVSSVIIDKGTADQMDVTAQVTADSTTNCSYEFSDIRANHTIEVTFVSLTPEPGPTPPAPSPKPTPDVPGGEDGQADGGAHIVPQITELVGTGDTNNLAFTFGLVALFVVCGFMLVRLACKRS